VRSNRVFFIVLALSLSAFFAGGTYTFLLSKDKNQDVYKSLEKFARVYDIVKKNYVKEPADQGLVDGSIRGMLEELDPHSVYLKKEDFEDMQADTKGEFGGLGIEISKKDGMLTVVSPIEDTPAFKAGIKAGDVISKIETQSTAKMSVMDAVRLMRGKPGTKVSIEIRRQGTPAPLNMTVARAVIQVRSVTYQVKDGFGVIKVRQFLERSSKEVKNALSKIQSETGSEIKGVILDLRNNPGGLLQQAIEISDIWLKDGLIVYTQGRDEEKASKYYAMARGTEPTYPLALLLNGGSASASEIVAGALQDQKRAHVIGTNSFGKGSVQNVIPLDDGSGIKLTVALYYTPNGRQIQGAGIVPDEVVKGALDADELTKERDLPGHLVGTDEEKAKAQFELEKKSRAESAAKKATDKANEQAGADLKKQDEADPQLDRALVWLKSQSSKKK